MDRGPALSWTTGPRKSRSIRLLCYLLTAFVGGVIIVGAGFLVTLLVRGSTDEPSLLGALFVALAVAFLRLRPQIALIGNVEPGEPFASFRAVSRPRWRVLAALAGAGISLLALRLGDGFMAAWAFVALVGGLVLPGLLSSSGEVDPEGRVLRYRGVEVPLDQVTSYRRVALGGYTFLRLAFREGTPGSSTYPRLYVLPTRVFERAEPAFEAGVEREGDAGGRATNRRVLLAVAVGWSALTLGTGSLLFRTNVDPVVALLLVAMLGVPALVLVDAALRST